MEDRQVFSREFKQHVVNEVETGKLNKEEARLKYGIKGNSAILNWQRQFILENQEITMKQSSKTMNREELENRVKELEKALADAKFKSRAYEIYVEELEKEIGKPQSKKYVTGQLTRLTRNTGSKD